MICLMLYYGLFCSHVIILGDINTSHKKIDHCNPDDDAVSLREVLICVFFVNSSDGNVRSQLSRVYLFQLHNCMTNEHIVSLICSKTNSTLSTKLFFSGYFTIWDNSGAVMIIGGWHKAIRVGLHTCARRYLGWRAGFQIKRKNSTSWRPYAWNLDVHIFMQYV